MTTLNASIVVDIDDLYEREWDSMFDNAFGGSEPEEEDDSWMLEVMDLELPMPVYLYQPNAQWPALTTVRDLGETEVVWELVDSDMFTYRMLSCSVLEMNRGYIHSLMDQEGLANVEFNEADGWSLMEH